MVGSVFVWGTILLALTLLASAILPFGRRRLVLVTITGVVSLLVTIGAVHEATSVGWIQPALPTKTLPWVWAFVFAIPWVVVGWRTASIRQRITACAAVPATGLMALTLFNAFFFYYPTFATLVGSPAVHQATDVQARAIARSARLEPGVGPKPSAHGLSMVTHGVTLPVSIPTPISHFATDSAWVYLPPAWFGPERPNLPVILLLGGTPSNAAEWLRGGFADQYADAYAARHHGFAPVIAMLNDNGGLTSDTECVDRPNSLAETYVTVDVRNALISRFAVTPDPAHWGIAGLSEGGLCALNIALRHPDEFRVLGDFSGNSKPTISPASSTLDTLFHGNRRMAASYDPNRLMVLHRYPGMSAMFVAGNQDNGRIGLRRQAALAQRAGMHMSFREVVGGHTFWVWRRAFQDFLPFAMQALAPAHGTMVESTASAVRNRMVVLAPGAPAHVHQGPALPNQARTPRDRAPTHLDRSPTP